MPGDRTSRHQVLDTGVTALPISSLNLIIVANSKIIITFATCDLKTIKLIILNPEIGSIVTGNGQKTSLTNDIFSYKIFWWLFQFVHCIFQQKSFNLCVFS